MKEPDPEIQKRLPPGQVLTQKWPVLTYGLTPHASLKQWSFRCFGLVEREASWTWEEFLKLPRVEITSDVHCVTRWSKLDNLWEGVSTREVIGLAGPLPEAKFVIVHAAGGFTTNLTLEDFSAEDALLAVKHEGKPLTAEHGYPVRLIVPRLYLWKSAKWLEGLEFTDKDRPGFWERAGYHNHGDPWKEERYG